ADNVSLAADASTVALLDQTEEEETTSIGANIGNERVIKGKRCTIRVLDCLTSRELCRWNDANLAIGWSNLKRGSAEVSVPPFHTPDGRMLVSATGKNQVVRITEIASGKEVVRLPGGNFELRLKFTADGSHFATHDEDNMLCIVSTDSGRVVRRVSEPVETYLRDYDFSPDGKILVERRGDSPLR